MQPASDQWNVSNKQIHGERANEVEGVCDAKKGGETFILGGTRPSTLERDH
jgi:hypothetical protein